MISEDDESSQASNTMELPKKSLSAFFHYQNEHLDKFVKLGMSVSAAAKAVGEEWRNLADKSKWEKLKEGDFERYKREMQAYSAAYHQ
jgi:hypothetical protein